MGSSGGVDPLLDHGEMFVERGRGASLYAVDWAGR